MARKPSQTYLSGFPRPRLITRAFSGPNSLGQAASLFKRGLPLGPVLLGLAVIWISACRTAGTVPTLIAVFDSEHREIKITEWQIAGPFPTGEKSDVPAGKQLPDFGIDRDYLAAAGRAEAQMTAADFPNIGRGLTERFYIPSNFNNARVRVENGAVRFDHLFPDTKNAVAYAASVIESPREEELVLVSGADDSMKLWLNHELLLTTSTKALGGLPAYGNLGAAGNFTSVRLRAGRNFLLVKVTQHNRMWGVNCSLATLTAAQDLAKPRGIYIHDVMENAIVSPGGHLRLAQPLDSLLRTLKLPAQIEILNAIGEVVSSEQRESGSGWTRPLTGLPEGLYTCQVTSPLYRLTEPFFHGDIETRLASYPPQLGAMKKLNEKQRIDFETLLIRRAHLFDPENREPENREWQAKVVYLVGEFDRLRLQFLSGRESLNYPGTHLRGFRSRIDNQIQHYMIHVPERSKGVKERLPLVVVVPFPLPNRPFLKSVHVANIDLIRTYANLANQRGYALLWPFARGNTDGTPIAMTDIFETLEAARSDYDFDNQRIYLFGWSYGGTYALLMGERFAGLFAAIGVVSPPSDLGAFEQAAREVRSPYPLSWLKLNSPLDLAESLSNTPVILVHGSEDNAIPLEQSEKLAAKSRQAGSDIRLEIIAGMDHVYSPVDPNVMIFDFFKDKVLNNRPERVALATGQLKYGSAYWLKIDRLTVTPKLARITASLQPNGTIEVEAENVARYTIDLKRLEHSPGKELTVITNGQITFKGIPGPPALTLDIAPLASAPLQKTQDLEGPIAHAFAGPFLLVEGTGGTSESRTIEQISRKLRDGWMSFYFVDCEVKKDSEITRQDIEEKNLVLLGNADTNWLIRQVLPSLPLKIESGSVSLGDRRFPGEHVGFAVVYPNPLSRSRYLVIVGANNLSGFQLLESHPSQRAWYDFAVWDSLDLKHRQSIVKGYWDGQWQQIQIANE